MSFETELQKIKEEITNNLPPEIKVKKIEFEGPEIAVYSENSDLDAIESSSLLKDLAKTMRKRIVFRWNVEKRKDPAETEAYIKNLVGEEAEISDIEFDHTRGEVIISSGKPGLVIGKMSEGQLVGGIKHSLFLIIIGVLIFSISGFI